ncbi:DUF4262 domain-containing protein [Streptomyces sp. NPDC094447]|uniref:DUF4262 domain-containing protein n=1 Tax=Streptomyces sp. NPDC094447 TaxID=3366062 RepID=UPI0037FFC948
MDSSITTDDETRIIRERGHAVRWVFDPDGVKPPFAYTLGLCSQPWHGDYELALVGLPARLAGTALNSTVDQLILQGLTPAEGLEVTGVLVGFPVRLRRAADTRPFPGMRSLFGHQPDVWQVLIPDSAGRFPDADNYGDNRQAQPLM